MSIFDQNRNLKNKRFLAVRLDLAKLRLKTQQKNEKFGEKNNFSFKVPHLRLYLFLMMF